MVGGIRGENRDRVSWASRNSDSSASSLRRTSSQSLGGFSSAAESPTAPRPSHTFFSPGDTHYVEDSPQPMSRGTANAPPAVPSIPGRDTTSAPAELHDPHRQLSSLTNPPHLPQISLDTARLKPVAPILQKSDPDGFELDKNAPVRAAAERSKSAGAAGSSSSSSGSGGAIRDELGVKRWDAVGVTDIALEVVEEVDERGSGESRNTPQGGRGSKSRSPPGPQGAQPDDPALNQRLEQYSRQQQENILKGKGRADAYSAADPPDPTASATPGQTQAVGNEAPVWGESFRVEWVRTDRLPFFRTRHLRNPWNHDREVKVSRDGTELEPSVGQALLDEWEKMDAEAASGTSRADEKRPALTRVPATEDPTSSGRK